MTASESLKQAYHRDRIRALLSCRAGVCGIHVWSLPSTSPGDDISADAPLHGELEVLLQPRAANGLPQGLARRLFEAPLTLHYDPRLRRSVGHVPLPFRMTPGLLRECHLRVRWDTIERSLHSTDSPVQSG